MKVLLNYLKAIRLHWFFLISLTKSKFEPELQRGEWCCSQSPFKPLNLNRFRALMRVCLQRRDCGNVTGDISLKLKEEASEGRRALSSSKDPSRHLGLDKRTWQISKWSPMYYISVRTPSASLPLCTFISDTDILTQRRGGGVRVGEGGLGGCGVCPIQFPRWSDWCGGVTTQKPLFFNKKSQLDKHVRLKWNDPLPLISLKINLTPLV